MAERFEMTSSPSFSGIHQIGLAGISIGRRRAAERGLARQEAALAAAYDEHAHTMSGYAVPPEIMDKAAVDLETAIASNPDAYRKMLDQMRQSREDSEAVLDTALLAQNANVFPQ